MLSSSPSLWTSIAQSPMLGQPRQFPRTRRIDMTQDGSAPIWWNFSGNIEYLPPTDGQPYYFTPTNLADLQDVLAAAKQNSVPVRVSGHRDSQPPLVTEDNRTPP